MAVIELAANLRPAVSHLAAAATLRNPESSALVFAALLGVVAAGFV